MFIICNNLACLLWTWTTVQQFWRVCPNSRTIIWWINNLVKNCSRYLNQIKNRVPQAILMKTKLLISILWLNIIFANLSSPHHPQVLTSPGIMAQTTGNRIFASELIGSFLKKIKQVEKKCQWWKIFLQLHMNKCLMKSCGFNINQKFNELLSCAHKCSLCYHLTKGAGKEKLINEMMN